MNKLLVTLLLTLVSPALVASDLAGFWKHEEQPGWIEVEFVDGVGTGTVRRNDKFPERVGTELLRNIKPGKEDDTWVGEVYAARSNDYRDVTITLSKSEQVEMNLTVKVGFISRTLTWVRVDEIPEAE